MHFTGDAQKRLHCMTKLPKAKQQSNFDVTLLYTWVNKTGKILMDHPNIITENFKDIAEYGGLVKCKVLAPRRLYMPVLPTKCNGKILFRLCCYCGETYQQTSREQTDEERALMGTWRVQN